MKVNNPFEFHDGHVAYDVQELVALCKQSQIEAIDHLLKGHFEIWLNDIGRSDLADVASQIRSTKDEDHIKLEKFIKICNSESDKSSLDEIKLLLKNESKKKFTFLLVGRTGVGKSSTINTLIGQKVAEVGKFRPTTTGINLYESQIEGINFVLIDTPGLADSSDNEQQYINSIKSDIPEFDCMWFVTILGENRLRDDEKKSLKIISSAFGEEAWKRAIIIFTHADKIISEEYLEYLQERTKLIHEEITKYVNFSIVEKIPSVAVANDAKTGKSIPTPDGELWLGKLYTTVFNKISKDGMLPFLLATSSRLRSVPSTSVRRTIGETIRTVDSGVPTGLKNISNSEPIPITPDQKAEIKKSIQKNFDFGDAVGMTLAGAAIGTAAGPVGTIVGGVIGAGISVIAWLWGR